MSVIKLDVEPGVVSAIYFIIFDIFMLAIVDVVLIHVVSWLYYRRIRKGIPLDVKSAEIPGVATSLVGRFTSPPNIVAYGIKILLLACILIVDSNIETEFIRTKESTALSSTFLYEPSDKSWSTSQRRIVERRWEEIRQCHIVNDKKNNATFYAIAFNLHNDIVLETEVTTDLNNPNLVGINDSTIQCLAEEKVSNSSSRILAQVIGCSQFLSKECFNETAISITFSEDQLVEKREGQQIITLPEGSGLVSFLFEEFDGEANQVFKDYPNPSLACLRSFYGIPEDRKLFESCVLISFSEDDNSTLIERWEMNRINRTLTRKFPGPIFKGFIDIGRYQKAVVLHNIVVDLNWISFSGQVIADGVIYKSGNFNIEKLGKSISRTTVPIFTIVLTLFLILASGVARIVVACTIAKDERPQLNTINGLSSVAREENEPSGRSMDVGRCMVIGLTKRDGRSVHFGPMTERDIGVTRERGEFIE